MEGKNDKVTLEGDTTVRYRVPKFTVSNMSTQGLYPFIPSKPSIFSWRAIASQHSMLMSGSAGHIYIRLAIARQERIDSLQVMNGHNPWVDILETVNFGTLFHNTLFSFMLQYLTS